MPLSPRSIQQNDALRPWKPLLRYPSVHFYRLKHEQLIHTVSILLVNAVAILSEDRFLARSTFIPPFQPAAGYHIKKLGLVVHVWLFGAKEPFTSTKLLLVMI